MSFTGQIVGGEFGDIIIRQKSDEEIELGELLIAYKEDDKSEFMILQVYTLEYGSQTDTKILEMMSGLQLEGFGEDTEYMEKDLRNYIIGRAKAVLHVKKDDTGWVTRIPKILPPFFTKLEKINEESLKFLTKPDNPVYIGNIRTGSKVLPVKVYLNGEDMLTHHVIIPATTGRGKSNVVKVMVMNLLDCDYCGLLIMDPHDEYYGRGCIGLKDVENADENLIYYSRAPINNQPTLRCNLSLIKPYDMMSVLSLTEAQERACLTFYREYKDIWIKKLLTADEDYGIPDGVQEVTHIALKRKISIALGVRVANGKIISRDSIFTDEGGESFVDHVVKDLEDGKKVIIDTSRISEDAEILIASMIMSEVLQRHRAYKGEGTLDDKPVISAIIEEAPRVLSGEKHTIFRTIAREGRKFKVGIVAVTQLVNMIPREILANMNTKIIMGTEMKQERDAIIGSASQDLSKEAKMIASLDRGEAIVSSIFTKFAIPITVPKFEDVAKIKKENKRNIRIFV